MKTVAIIQTRMGSSRLPGKVMMDLAGETMLSRVVSRVREARSIDEIVIATTTEEADDQVVTEARRLGCHPFRGSQSDVLARYLGAARETGAEVVVRMTSDCPLLDPWVIDQVVTTLTPESDYASNTRQRSYPRGLDVEAFHRDTLERIARMARSDQAREHVTAFLVERPELFQVTDVVAAQDDSDLRWTVDAAEDLDLVRKLYQLPTPSLGSRPYRELVAMVRASPGFVLANAHIIQKAVHVP